VRKGEKGTRIVWSSPYTYKRAGDIDEDGEQIERAGMALKGYTVFNAEQIDGLDLPEIEAEEFDPIERAEAIIENMPTPPRISHGGERAYYKPSADHVKVPVRGSYSPATEFYSTMFHELGHSTGHPSRLNRFGPDAKTAPFGTPEYSREELVAEFTAAYLCQMSGIDNTLDLSASYLANWSKVLRNDKTMLIAGASKGSAAADYIMGR
jgi:antirestriction protein ArdC